MPGLRDELVAFIQQSIHSHRSTTGWDKRLDTDAAVVKELDKLCDPQHTQRKCTLSTEGEQGPTGPRCYSKYGRRPTLSRTVYFE